MKSRPLAAGLAVLFFCPVLHAQARRAQRDRRALALRGHGRHPRLLLGQHHVRHVAAPPHLWKLTDTNGDSGADERVAWYDGQTLTGCANDLHGLTAFTVELAGKRTLSRMLKEDGPPDHPMPTWAWWFEGAAEIGTSPAA